ncbi:MAG: 3-oxoacyl-[acyl-carrier protein] reductase [Rhodospirillaceae bacterium]|nr:3-oxoacyl-[acyl-carrier protein] reductase [Rhodospirillaceae bacterium]
MGMLSNKVALVTGGARGIGASIAKRLSDEGAAVSITYATSKQRAGALVAAIEDKGGRALAIQADSAAVNDVKAAIAKTVNVLGRLDILVNNAAIIRPGTISDYSLDDLDEMIAVNIKGLFIATQEAVRHMGDGGRIINIGSVSSDYMPIAGQAVYAMTKGAVASLTRGLARDLGPRGITINNVQPGRIDTEMLRAAVGPKAAEIRETIALGRFGTCNEVAGFVAYLTSPEAAFVTGANLKIDGGASL